MVHGELYGRWDYREEEAERPALRTLVASCSAAVAAFALDCAETVAKPSSAPAFECIATPTVPRRPGPRRLGPSGSTASRPARPSCASSSRAGLITPTPTSRRISCRRGTNTRSTLGGTRPCARCSTSCGTRTRLSAQLPSRLPVSRSGSCSGTRTPIGTPRRRSQSRTSATSSILQVPPGPPDKARHRQLRMHAWIALSRTPNSSSATSSTLPSLRRR